MITYSKSKLNTFLTCSEKYRIHYELGIRAPKASPSLVEGSCIHHLIEQALMYGRHVEDVLPVASHGFWEDHPFENCAYPSERHYYAAQDLCLTQAETFLQMLGPLQAQSIEVEIASPLMHPLTGAIHSEISLRGFIDLIITDSDGNPVIIDIKTVGRKPKTGMAGIALELSFYAYLHEQPFTLRDFPTVSVALLYLVRTRSQDVIWDEGRRSLFDYLQLYNLCVKVTEDITNRQFWKNPGMHCGWCDFNCFCYADHDTAIDLYGRELWEMYMHDQVQQTNAVTSDVVNF